MCMRQPCCVIISSFAVGECERVPAAHVQARQTDRGIVAHCTVLREGRQQAAAFASWAAWAAERGSQRRMVRIGIMAPLLTI